MLPVTNYVHLGMNGMKAATRKSIQFSRTGLGLLRTVLASYFIALALGLIASTDVTLLPKLILGENQANFVANTSVFILAYLVLMGIWLRPAALILGAYFLASSAYVTLPNPSPESMSSFWRDVALLAGLMMTYFQASQRGYMQTPVVRTAPKVRHVQPGDPILPKHIANTRVGPKARPVRVRTNGSNAAEVINIFAA